MSDTTDCQLLQLAAKAAGIKALRDPHGAWRDCTNCVPLMNIFSAPTWNPLTDDGDALRLAVKLKIYLSINQAVRVDYRIEGAITVPLYEALEPGPYAATRRAITRAAAEIGKAMQLPGFVI